MRPLMSDVDVVIANEEDLQSVLGVRIDWHRRDHGNAQRRCAIARLPNGSHASSGPPMVAITLRESLSAQ